MVAVSIRGPASANASSMITPTAAVIEPSSSVFAFNSIAEIPRLSRILTDSLPKPVTNESTR